MDIIVPKFNKGTKFYRNLTEAMHADITPDDITIDVWADVKSTDKKGNIVDAKSFRCHSFVGNYLKMMCSWFRMSAYPGVKANDGIVNYIGASMHTYDGNTRLSGYPAFVGPIIGTGTTPPTCNDYRLEKKITPYLDLVPSDPAASGTSDAVSNNNHQLYDTGVLADEQWDWHLIRITGGNPTLEAEGPKIIYDTQNNYLSLIYSSTYGYAYHKWSEPPHSCDYEIYTNGAFGTPLSSVSIPEDDTNLTSWMTLSRIFSNGTGVDFNGVAAPKISEFGLNCIDYSYIDNSRYHRAILVIRDVQDPGVVVLNGNDITLTYTITVTA